MVDDAVIFPLIPVVRVPPTSCVRGSLVEVIEAVPFCAPVLATTPDIVPVAYVLASKSERVTFGVASAPLVTLSEPVRVRIS